MWDSFLLNPNGPQGDEIRAQLGKSYHCIQVPGEYFHCRWHRLEAAGQTSKAALSGIDFFQGEEGATDSHIPVPMQVPREFENSLKCEGYAPLLPAGVRSDGLAPGLPIETLPDGRRVVFVPDVPQWGPYVPAVWRRLVEAAKEARPKLIEHAYKVALGVLGLWKEIGPAMGAIRSRCENAEAEGKTYSEILREVDPSGRDRGLARWVYYWARERHDHPEVPFTPFKEARLVVSRATGIAASTIGTIVGRDAV
jgi:hypothetical protein